jgi:hypothetical protein
LDRYESSLIRLINLAKFIELDKAKRNLLRISQAVVEIKNVNGQTLLPNCALIVSTLCREACNVLLKVEHINRVQVAPSIFYNVKEVVVKTQ